MSRPQSLQLDKLGGYGRGEGYLGGLKEEEFSSLCPPDVQPNTRIIAVCGASDTKGFGSPDQDGWFFSDFYLFHHLLEDSPTFHAASQLWLSCANPKDLVERYGEFAHGSWQGDRRVVLDASMLDHLEQANNIRVHSSTALLERFLGSLKEEVETAARLNQPVLVLVFGHGDEGMHGVAIGGDSQDNAPRLTMKRFEACLRKEVEVTLMITSCYSGGWVTKPRVRPLRPSRPYFNITAISAANAENMSRSWAVSKSVGRRAGGSMLATAVMNALMCTSKSTPGFAHMCSAFDSIITETEDGEALQYEPTYISLTKAVQDAMKIVDPSLWQKHGISFAAQDDKWDLAWRTRTGFPLLNYQHRWEQLRRLPVGAEGHDESEESTHGLTGGSLKGSSKIRYSILREKAYSYLNSFPGDDNSGCNSVHAQFRRLLKGELFDDQILTYMEDVLEYRDSLLDLATDFVAILDLNFACAKEFDVRSWFEKNAIERGTETLDRYQKVHKQIAQTGLFGLPLQGQGPSYEKPKEYLAIALISTNLSMAEIQTRLTKLHKLHNARKYLLSRSPIGIRAMEDREVIRSRKALREKLGNLGERLRSPSPTKR